MCAVKVRQAVAGCLRGCVSVGLLCIVVTAFAAGCATKTTVVEELGQFPAAGPTVLSGTPKEGAEAYTEVMKDLSEAQWEILEQFAPRSTWERLRAQNKTIIESRRKVAQAVGGGQEATTKPASLPVVRTETLSDGKIQMYYRVRYFGGSSVSTKRDGGMSRAKVVVKEGNLKQLVDLVTKRLGGKGSVMVLNKEQVLVIICEADMKDSVLRLLQYADSPLPQVEISGQIFEVNSDMDFQVGVRSVLTHRDSRGALQQGFAGLFSAADFAAGASGAFPGSTPDPGTALQLVDVFGKSGINASFTIQALASSGLAKMIAQPRITADLGYSASLLAGQELPVSQARISGNNNFVSEKTTYKPIGVQLYVTPLAIGDKSVKLHILAVVSSIQGFVEFPQIDSLTTPVLNPIIDTREVETTVTVPDGSALVIGGLRKIRTVTGESKTPGLGDIPILGWLFKVHRSQKQTTDLYFFVTPKIIRR